MDEHGSLMSEALNNMTLNELASNYAYLYLTIRALNKRLDLARSLISWIDIDDSNSDDLNTLIREWREGSD